MESQRVQLDKSRLAPQSPSEPAAESAAATNPPAANAAPAPPLTPQQVQDLEEKIVATLKTCFDPEIPINIYELGLIYGVEVEESGKVAVRMTLTSPACPVAGSLPPEVEAKIRALPGVTSAKVDVVWDPPWEKEMMSEAARLELGIFD
jgi:FeS assembly SUF system protein